MKVINKKISQVLIESQETRKQITDRLVEGNGKPEAYCALGALACEADLIKYVDDANFLSCIDVDEKILGQYLDLERINLIPTKIIPFEIYNKLFGCGMVLEQDLQEDMRLANYIVNLNDAGFTFKEIGEEMKRLEDLGYIIHKWE